MLLCYTDVNYFAKGASYLSEILPGQCFDRLYPTSEYEMLDQGGNFAYISLVLLYNRQQQASD